MEALVRKADASSHSHPRQYGRSGFRMLAYLIWQGVAIAAPQNAADLATAGRTPGILLMGFVAARQRAIRSRAAASGWWRRCCFRHLHCAALHSRRGQKKRDGDPSGYSIPLVRNITISRCNTPSRFDRDETRPMRRGRSSATPVRFHRGLLSGRTAALLRVTGIRVGRKRKLTRGRCARTPPRYTGDFLAGDVLVRSCRLVHLERGSANSGRTTVWTGNRSAPCWQRAQKA